jgi:hypothetical protein
MDKKREKLLLPLLISGIFHIYPVIMYIDWVWDYFYPSQEGMAAFEPPPMELSGGSLLPIAYVTIALVASFCILTAIFYLGFQNLKKRDHKIYFLIVMVPIFFVGFQFGGMIGLAIFLVIIFCVMLYVFEKMMPHLYHSD